MFLHYFHVCGVNLENDMPCQKGHLLYPYVVFHPKLTPIYHQMVDCPLS